MKFFSLLSLVSVVSGVRLGDRFDSWLDEYKIHVEDGDSYLSMFDKWAANDNFIQRHNFLC